MRLRVRGIREILLLTLVIIGMTSLREEKVRAASASITLESISEPVQVGELFSVSVTVKSSGKIGEMTAKIKYDTDRIQFASQNGLFSENQGEITITDTESESNKTKKYILEFRANEAKTARIWVEGTPSVYDSNGNILSVSKNVLQVSVGERKEKSSNKDLANLSIKEGKLNKTFHKSVTAYTMKVSNEVKRLKVTAVPADAAAKVKIEGADKLLVGENKVVITVTSEMKGTKQYTITVTRSGDVLGTPLPSKSPEVKATVTPEKPTVETKEMIDKYEFVSLDNLRKLPADYLSVPLTVGEKNVDAYQIERQKDKDVFLVYAKYDGGSPEFYLYDQKEATIQRYVPMEPSRTVEAGMVSIEDYNNSVETLGTMIGVCAGIITLLAYLLIHFYRKAKEDKREWE